MGRTTLRLAGLGLALVAAAPGAHAVFHLWRLNEVYTNADGTVQFVEMFTTVTGQHLVAGHDMTTRNPDNSERATFTFPGNSSAPTNNHHLLLATSAFAAAAGVTPDFILPNGFLNPAGVTVNFVGADTVTFGPFPTNRSQSLTRNGAAATATPTNYFGQAGALSAIDPAVSLVASVLPTSRSVTVGTTATAFATMINTGTAAGDDCALAPVTALTATFFYQTTDPVTNAPIGSQDTPADVAPGASQSFVFGVTPSGAFAPTDLVIDFECANSNAAVALLGINTLLLSASTTPVPDLVALGATTTNDGIVHIPGATGTHFFTLASVNVGAGGALTVTADTGSAVLPLQATMCQTDPVTSVCTNPTAPTTSPVAVDIAANATPTFAVFVTGSDTITLDPAGKRIFVRFRDGGGSTRGATSVAVQTD